MQSSCGPVTAPIAVTGSAISREKIMGFRGITLLLLLISASVVIGIDQRRRHALKVHSERIEMRRENERRGISHHGYRRGFTPIRFTWESINLSISAERAGSQRWAGGLTAM